MKKGLIIAGVIVLVLVLFLSPLMGKYNQMVSSEENISGKWAQVETQLQRRIDLIPNLVNTVKGYAEHEQETFMAVTEARSKAASAGTVSEKAEANTELAGALNRMMLVVENYPELKANENFIRLQDELAGTENRISVTRKDYNEAVQSYNTYIKSFPNNLIAGMFNFEKRDYFEADEGAQEVPEVEF